MSRSNQTTIRRWDGQSKVASIWDALKLDPDFDVDGDCLVYLSEPMLFMERPSLTVPLERLIATKCSPLYEMLTTADAYPRKSKFRSRWKKHFYTLCIEAPELLGLEAVRSYHITTRNFFGWLMNKPVVGSDPASALASLKLRMDLWRAPTVDNFSDLYIYARRQGYGDLGDASAFLTGRLTGRITGPDEYRMVSAPTDDSSVNSENNSRFKSFLSKKTRNVRLHIPAFRHGNLIKSLAEKVSIPSSAASHSNEALMSGAVSLDDQDSMSLVKLAKVEPGSGHQIASDDGKPSRSYSMPVLPSGSIYDVSRELEKRSSWIEFLARDNIERYKPIPRKSLSVPDTGIEAAVYDKPSAPIPPIPRPTPLRMSTYRRKSSLQLSRPPSPIEEEATAHVPPVPVRNPRRHSFDAINLRDKKEPETPMSSLLLQNTNLLGTSQTPMSVGRPASTTTTFGPKTTPSGVSSCLPSQTVMSCNACGKPKPPESVRRSLTARWSAALNERQAKLSLNSEVTSDEQTYKNLPAESAFSEAPSSALKASELILTRFPSLQNLKLDTGSADSESKNITSPASMSGIVLYPFQHRNLSEPNLRSSLAKKETQRRKRVTIEIPRSDNIMTSRNSEQNSVNTTARQMPVPFTSAAEIYLPSSLVDQDRLVDVVDRPVEALDPITISSHNRRHDSLSTAISDLYTQEPSIENETVHGNSLLLMDSLLDEIAVPDKNTYKFASPTETAHHPISPAIEETNPTKLYVSIIASADRKQESLTAKSSMKNRVRNTLRTWSFQRKSMDKFSSQVYQGNILVMDASGNFSTIASPVTGESEFDWEEEEEEEEIIDERQKLTRMVYELP